MSSHELHGDSKGVLLTRPFCPSCQLAILVYLFDKPILPPTGVSGHVNLSFAKGEWKLTAIGRGQEDENRI